ncbi:MAG: hypothetical protein HY051_03405 [Candidatus Aenigmarchaeota archaeon]|nr:hypothetical protein [Candidatus Aenigmarchaeota archaeon]
MPRKAEVLLLRQIDGRTRLMTIEMGKAHFGQPDAPDILRLANQLMK